MLTSFSAHYGKEFYFAIPPPSSERSQITNFTRRLEIVALNNGRIDIELPYRNYKTHIFLNAESAEQFQLPNDFVAKTSLIETVYVTSSVDVAVFVTQANEDLYDTFLTFPIDALGTKYLVPYALIMSVMATSNHTIVNVTFSNGTSQVHGLNRFEVYSTVLPLDIDGYVNIWSNNAVSVFSGAYCYFFDICGFAVLQHIPYDKWDRFYITSPNEYQSLDMEGIVILNPALTPVANCGLYSHTLHSTSCDVSDSSELVLGIPIENKTTVLFSSNTFQVYILLELFKSFSNLPGLHQYLSDYSFVIPKHNFKTENYIKISVVSSRVRSLRLDNEFLTDPVYSYTVPEPFSKYIVMVFRINFGYHRLLDEDGVPFGLICEGLIGTDVYLYPAGFSFHTGNTLCQLNIDCLLKNFVATVDICFVPSLMCTRRCRADT